MMVQDFLNVACPSLYDCMTIAKLNTATFNLINRYVHTHCIIILVADGMSPTLIILQILWQSVTAKVRVLYVTSAVVNI